MKTKTTMLDYCKKVLKAVAFDKALFIKEYQKSHTWLTNIESNQLKSWVRNEYSTWV